MNVEDKKAVQAERKEGVQRMAEMTRDLPVFVPATDICESKDAIEVVCDMPGVPETQVDVSLEDNVLTITGCQAADEAEGYDLVHRGYREGMFRRAFTLTDEIDRGRIRARMAQGVLRLILPKAEKSKPRKIAVEAEK
ncbi:MAG: Hsp20/alpha crystallin family protein [Lentisphaerae bacterium]|nr:Hsp20/alpha crystallin family protein [Lentisphaerota bacterium]